MHCKELTFTFIERVFVTLEQPKNVASQKGLIKVRKQKVNDSSKKIVGVKVQNGDSLLEFLDQIIGHNYPNYQNNSFHLSQNKSL